MIPGSKEKLLDDEKNKNKKCIVEVGRNTSVNEEVMSYTWQFGFKTQNTLCSSMQIANPTAFSSKGEIWNVSFDWVSEKGQKKSCCSCFV